MDGAGMPTATILPWRGVLSAVHQVFWLDPSSYALLGGTADTPLTLVSQVDSKAKACAPGACVTFLDDLVSLEADAEPARWFAATLPAWDAHVLLFSNASGGAVLTASDPATNQKGAPWRKWIPDEGGDFAVRRGVERRGVFFLNFSFGVACFGLTLSFFPSFWP